MSGTMETKLFKTVCKRAALMRAPYAQSSWTTNTSPIKKKKSTARCKKSISVANNTNKNNNKLLNKKMDIVEQDPKQNADKK
ncbi:unnamed protein product [Rotaria sp. Silwood2]|nr:unnamed protein product [Rotaria sp. Silwood2]CAF4656606.1 unnamed protein product [Rotaria sp. Silwood2]